MIPSPYHILIVPCVFLTYVCELHGSKMGQAAPFKTLVVEDSLGPEWMDPERTNL